MDLHNPEKLNDHDTLQVGVTKFVLRFNTSNIEKILEEVGESEYLNTVAIEN